MAGTVIKSEHIDCSYADRKEGAEETFKEGFPEEIMSTLNKDEYQ